MGNKQTKRGQSYRRRGFTTISGDDLSSDSSSEEDSISLRYLIILARIIGLATRYTQEKRGRGDRDGDGKGWREKGEGGVDNGWKRDREGRRWLDG